MTARGGPRLEPGPPRVEKDCLVTRRVELDVVTVLLLHPGNGLRPNLRPNEVVNLLLRHSYQPQLRPKTNPRQHLPEKTRVNPDPRHAVREVPPHYREDAIVPRPYRKIHRDGHPVAIPNSNLNIGPLEAPWTIGPMLVTIDPHFRTAPIPFTIDQRRPNSLAMYNVIR